MASEADTEEYAETQARTEEKINKTGTRISSEDGSQLDQVTATKAEDHESQKSNEAASKGNDVNTNGESFLYPPIVEKVVSTDEERHTVDIPEAGSSVTEEILTCSTGQQMNEEPQISEDADEHTADTTSPNAEEKDPSNDVQNEKQIAPMGETDKEKEGSDYQVMETSHHGELEIPVGDQAENLESSKTEAEVGGSNEVEQFGDKENLEVKVEETSDRGLTEIIASKVVMPSNGGDKQPIFETTTADKEVSINIPQSTSSDVAEDVLAQEASDSSVQDGHQNNENEAKGKEEKFESNTENAQEDKMEEVEAKAFLHTLDIRETVQDVFPENSLQNKSAGDTEEIQEAMSYNVSQTHKDQGTALELASTGEDQSRCETDSHPELAQGEASSGNNMIELEDIEKKSLEETLVKDSGETDAEDATADLSAQISEQKSVEVDSDGGGTENDALSSASQDFDQQEVPEQNPIHDLGKITGTLDHDISSNLNESVDFIGETQCENQDVRSELELKIQSEENEFQSKESIEASYTSRNTDCPAKNEVLQAATASHISAIDTRNEELSSWKNNNSNVKSNEGSLEGDNHTFDDGSPAHDFTVELHSTTEVDKLDPAIEQTSADHDTDETIAILQNEASPNLMSTGTEEIYRDEHEEEANRNSTEASESSTLNVKEEADDHTCLQKEIEEINATSEILKDVEKMSEGSADIGPSPEQNSAVHDLVEEKANLHNQATTDAEPLETVEMNNDEHEEAKKNSTETTENTSLNITEGADLTCKVRESEEINNDASEILNINYKSAVRSLDINLSSEHRLTVQDPDETIVNLQNKVGPDAMPTKTADMNHNESEEEPNQNSSDTSKDNTLKFTEEADDLTCQQRETEKINDTAEILMVDEKSAQRSVEIDLSTEHTTLVHVLVEKIADLQNDVDEPSRFLEVNVDEHEEELNQNFTNISENSTLNITGEADDEISEEIDHSAEHTLAVHDPDETIANQQNVVGTDGEPTRIAEVNFAEDGDEANQNASETSKNSNLNIIEEANNLSYQQIDGKEESGEMTAAEKKQNTSEENHHIAQNAGTENVAETLAEEKLMVSHQSIGEDSEQVEREINKLSDTESTQGHASQEDIDCCDQLREHPVEETAEKKIQPDIPDTDMLKEEFGTSDTNIEDKQITVEEKTDSDIANQNEVVSVDDEVIGTNANAEKGVPTQDDFSSNSNGNSHLFETTEEAVSEVEKFNQESEDPYSFDDSSAEEDHSKDMNADPSQNIDENATTESDIIEVKIDGELSKIDEFIETSGTDKVNNGEKVCHVSEESDHDNENGNKHAAELSQEKGENTGDANDAVQDIEVLKEAAVAKIEHDHAEDDSTKSITDSQFAEKELECCAEVATSGNFVTSDEGNNNANEGNSTVMENQDSTASEDYQEDGNPSLNEIRGQPKLDHEESANREENGSKESKVELNEEAPFFGKEVTDRALQEVPNDEDVTRKENEPSIADSNNSKVQENIKESEQNKFYASEEFIVAEDEGILNQRQEGSNSDGGKKSEMFQATACEDEVSTISDHVNLDIVAVDKKANEDQHEKPEDDDPSTIISTVHLEENAESVGPVSNCSESKVACHNGTTEESDTQQDKSMGISNSESTSEAVPDVKDITCKDKDLDAEFAGKESESYEAEEKVQTSSEDTKKFKVDNPMADDLEEQREESDEMKEGSSSLVNFYEENIKEALHVSETEKPEQVDGEGFPPEAEDDLKQPDVQIELDNACEEHHECGNEESVHITASPYVEEAELEETQQDAKYTINAQTEEEKSDGGILEVAAEETSLEQVTQRECELSISNFEPNENLKLQQELVETVRETDGSSAAAQQLSPNFGTSKNSSESEKDRECGTEQVDGDGFPPKAEDHLKQPDEQIEVDDSCEQQDESTNVDSVHVTASPYVEEAELEDTQQDVKHTISAQISKEEKPDAGNLQVAAEETYVEQVTQRECELSISNFEPNEDLKLQHELVETVRETDGPSAAAAQQLSPNVGTSENEKDRECGTERSITEDEIQSSNESEHTTISLIQEESLSTNLIEDEQVLLHCQEPTINEETTEGKYGNDVNSESVEEGDIRTEAQGHDAILTEDTVADSTREGNVTSITGNELNDESSLPRGKEELVKQKSEEDNSGSTEDNHQSFLLVQDEAGKGIQNGEHSEDVSNDEIVTAGVNRTIIDESPDNVLSEEVVNVDEQSTVAKMETSEEEVNTSNDANKPEEQAAKESEKANEAVIQELVDAPLENTEEEEKQAVVRCDKVLADVASVLEETSSPSCHQEQTIQRATGISAHEQIEQAETDQTNQYPLETKEVENQAAEETKHINEPHINQESDYVVWGEMSPRWSTEKLIVEDTGTSPEHYEDIREMTAADIIANQISLAIERDEQLEKQSHEKLKEQDEAETVYTDMHENTPETVFTDMNDKPVVKEENTEDTTIEADFPEVVLSSKSPGHISPIENDTEKVLQGCTASQAKDSLNENEIKEPIKSGEASNVFQLVDSISSLNYEENTRIDKDHKQVATFDYVDELTTSVEYDQENHQEPMSREIIAEDKYDSTIDPDQATITDAAREEKQSAEHKDDTVTERQSLEMEMIAQSQHEDITALYKIPAEHQKQTAAAESKYQSEKVQDALQTPETLDMKEKSMTRHEEEGSTKSKIPLGDGQVEALVAEKEDYILLEIPKTHASCLVPRTPEIAKDRKACTLADDCDSPSEEENTEQASIIYPEKHANGTHGESQNKNAEEQPDEKGLLNKYEENKDLIHQEPVICEKSLPADLKEAYEEMTGSFPTTGTSSAESNGNHVVSLDQQQEPVKESLQGEKADDSTATSMPKESTAITFSVKAETSPVQEGQIVERTREVEENNNVEPKTSVKEEIVTAEEQKTGMVKDDIEELDLMPITEEAMHEMDPKATQKKSHNILTGVGSKMKHSISKVKKAIACTSSQFTQDEVIIKVNKARKT